MSNQNNITPEDLPEFIPGDVVEVFNPASHSYQWIEVEEVLEVHGARVLVARGSHFCECWVKLDSQATPQMCKYRDKAA
jgi:hypothetical protein